jgi:hypothetical protein
VGSAERKARRSKMKKFYGSLAALVMVTPLVYAISASALASPRLDAEDVDIPAGPIWNNEDAKVKCPVACAAAGLHWNGQWTTVIWNVQSVCGCE